MLEIKCPKFILSLKSFICTDRILIDCAYFMYRLRVIPCMKGQKQDTKEYNMMEVSQHPYFDSNKKGGTIVFS